MSYEIITLSGDKVAVCDNREQVKKELWKLGAELHNPLPRKGRALYILRPQWQTSYVVSHTQQYAIL